MEPPRRPSQNEDPWFQAREAYDQWIEDEISKRPEPSRSFLPDGTDLNDLVEASDVGTYYVSPNYTYANFPEDPFSTITGGVLTVEMPIDARVQGGIQKCSWGANRWWREVTNRATKNWGPWRKVGDYGSRAAVPDGTDLNSLNKTTDNGVYYLQSSDTFGNMPVPANEFDSAGILKVEMPGQSGYLGGLQEVVWGDNRWWREVRNREEGTWYPWHRVPLENELPEGISSDLVSSATVRRIVLSANPNIPLEDGDLLILWEE